MQVEWLLKVRFDVELFDKIEKQSNKLYGSSKLGRSSFGDSQDERSTSAKGVKKSLSSEMNGLTRKKFT